MPWEDGAGEWVAFQDYDLYAAGASTVPGLRMLSFVRAVGRGFQSWDSDPKSVVRFRTKAEALAYLRENVGRRGKARTGAVRIERAHEMRAEQDAANAATRQAASEPEPCANAKCSHPACWILRRETS